MPGESGLLKREVADHSGACGKTLIGGRNGLMSAGETVGGWHF